MKDKTYNFKLPTKISFEELATAFIPGYEELSEETKQHSLQIYAYNCYGTPYFNPSGFPYCQLGEST